MPLYEYRCRTCGAQFEVIQRFSDTPVATCKECDGPVDKLLSASAFQLKGSGWYVTDYARKGSGKSAHGEKAGEHSESAAEKPEPKPKSEHKKSHDRKK